MVDDPPAIILDSSPILHFFQASRTEALLRLVEGMSCHVASPVIDHLQACDDRIAVWIRDAGFTVVSLQGVEELRVFVEYTQRLGSGPREVGEAATLGWAEVHGATAIVDEHVGHRYGVSRHVTVHRSPWLLMRGMCRTSALSSDEARVLVEELLTSGMALPVTSGNEFVDWVETNPQL